MAPNNQRGRIDRDGVRRLEPLPPNAGPIYEGPHGPGMSMVPIPGYNWNQNTQRWTGPTGKMVRNPKQPTPRPLSEVPVQIRPNRQIPGFDMDPGQGTGVPDPSTTSSPAAPGSIPSIPGVTPNPNPSSPLFPNNPPPPRNRPPFNVPPPPKPGGPTSTFVPGRPPPPGNQSNGIDPASLAGDALTDVSRGIGGQGFPQFVGGLTKDDNFKSNKVTDAIRLAGLAGGNPAAAENTIAGLYAAKWLATPTRTVKPFRSEESNRVMYGGQQVDNIATQRIRTEPYRRMNRSEKTALRSNEQSALNTREWAEADAARQGSQNMNTLETEAEVPVLFPPAGGQTANMTMSTQQRPDRLHMNATNTLWGDTHTQAMGNVAGDVHERATSGLPNQPLVVPEGIRAPRKRL